VTFASTNEFSVFENVIPVTDVPPSPAAFRLGRLKPPLGHSISSKRGVCLRRNRVNDSVLATCKKAGLSWARRVVENMMPFFQDVDGNFIQQFQTTAFDARVWELYLFGALTERKVVFDRTFTAPDYLCDFFGYQFFVEATIANPTTKNGIVVEPDPISMDKERLKSYFTDYMPIKWGSALWTKLNKRYWELPHVVGKPIVLAVQDFHIPQSMAFSPAPCCHICTDASSLLCTMHMANLSSPMSSEPNTPGRVRLSPQDCLSRETPNT
jgi:hypothetical protein